LGDPFLIGLRFPAGISPPKQHNNIFIERECIFDPGMLECERNCGKCNNNINELWEDV
jgi:hypothetical protein